MAAENYVQSQVAGTSGLSFTIDPIAPVTQITTSTGATGTCVASLGTPTLPGLRKIVEQIGGTNDTTIALTNVVVPAAISTNSTTLTLSASNRGAVFFSGNSKWFLVANVGGVIT